MQRFFTISAILAVCALSFLFYDHFGDIQLENITKPMPYEAKHELPPLTPEERLRVAAILDQTFTYKSEGGQSYVFSSEDGQYVLKLFKYKRFRPAWFLTFIPDIPLFHDWRTHHIETRAQKLDRVLEGHKVAFEAIRQESALLFVQLNPSDLPRNIKIVDKLGFHRNIDISQTAYVLQAQGEMLRTHFAKLLKEGDLDSIKEKIAQIFAIYLTEYQKGVHDQDHGVMQNFGFIKEQPFHLDVGKFAYNDAYKERSVYGPDLIKVSERMKNWFCKYYPNSCDELSAAIDNLLDDL